MKILVLISASMLVFGVNGSWAQSAGMSHDHGGATGAKDQDCAPSCGPAKVAAAKHEKAYPASGVVRKTDADTNTVTIAHDAIKGLGWPAMTMKFKVKDKALLDKMPVDKRIEFTLIQEGEEYVVGAVR